MKLSYFHSVALAGLLGCCSGSMANNGGEHRSANLPVGSVVTVKEVEGRVDYAYNGKGWRTLESGNVLHAGATIRAASGSALLRIPETAAFYRVSPSTRLQLISIVPASENRNSSSVIQQWAGDQR